MLHRWDALLTDLAAILGAGDPLLHRIAVLAAAATGSWLIARDSRAWPLPAGQRLSVLLAVGLGSMIGSAIPGLIAGGLVGDQVAFLAESRADAGAAFGGLLLLGPKTVVGGLLGGFAGAALFKRLARIPYDTSDAFARGACLLMVIGRLGCIAQHCCFGAPCPAWAGIDQGDGVPRWPVQVIEAAFQALLLVAIHLLHVRGLLPGRRLFIVFVAYGLARFGFEFLREPFGAPVLGLGFYHWLALLLAGVGAVELLRRARRTPG